MFKIGYLPLSKVNWTNDTLEAARADAIKFLKTLPDVEVIAPDHMLALEGEAIEVLDQWEKDRPDLIVAHFLTFSLGVVPPMFAQRLKVPILLWSQPEPDPKGGRLQNNSFCAANMNAHHMWRLGIPYFYVHAQAGTKEAEEKLRIATMSEKERKEYFAHVDAIMSQNDTIETYKKEGRDEGEAIGLARGRAEGAQAKALEMAKKMLAKGFDKQTVADLSGLPLEKVEKI